MTVVQKAKTDGLTVLDNLNDLNLSRGHNQNWKGDSIVALSNDNLRSKREFMGELAKEAKGDLERGEVPQDRVHLVYNSLGGDYRELGVLSSLLGEQRTAIEQFEEAAGYYLSGIRTTRKRWSEISGGNQESHPSILLKGLYCSLLSGDDELIEEVGRETLALDSEYPTEFPETAYKYYAAKALASAVIGAEEGDAHLEALSESLDGIRPELAQFFGAIGTVADGVFSDDDENVSEGLRQLLDHHSSTFSGEPATTSEAVSVPVSALLALAKHSGIEVSIEEDFVVPLVA